MFRLEGANQWERVIDEVRRLAAVRRQIGELHESPEQMKHRSIQGKIEALQAQMAAGGADRTRDTFSSAAAEVKSLALRQGCAISVKSYGPPMRAALGGLVKAVDPAAAKTVGAFTRYASSWDTDRDEEAFVPGAWVDSIAAAKSRRALPNSYPFVLLLSHDQSRPIGGFTADEDKQGLQIMGLIDQETQDGQKAWSLLS